MYVSITRYGYFKNGERERAMTTLEAAVKLAPIFLRLAWQNS